jgi:hypothetical protein
MSILGISSPFSTTQTSASSAATATSATATATDTTADQAAVSTAATPATKSHVSSTGRLLGFLQQLETQQPAEAKKVLGGIADKLRADASKAGPDAGRLNALADKFQKAADTGDLTGLAPTRAHGHGGHGGHAVRAYQAAAQPSAASSSVAELGALAPASQIDNPVTAVSGNTSAS